MLRLVVDAVKHDVFEGDEIAWGILQIPLTGLHEFGQWIFLVERHQRITQGIVAGMQRDSQRYGAILCQAVDAWYHTRRGNGDTPARQAIGMVVEHGLEGG